MKKEPKNNINFIFRSLDKRMITICLLLEAFLDIIYYSIPFMFTFYLTIPFTIKKATIVVSVFIVTKLIRAFVLNIERRVMDNYFYEYANLQYLEYYKTLTKVPVETLSEYQTGYLENMIEKISTLVQKILGVEYIGILLSFVFFFYTVYTQSQVLFIISIILSILCVILSVNILRKANKEVEDLYDKEYHYSSTYQDFISNIRTVNALNSNQFFEDIINKEALECYDKHKKYVKSYSFEELIRNILIVTPFALALIKSVIDLSNGIDTLGIITFYIAIYIEMGFIFSEVSQNIISFFELKALKKNLDKLFAVLDERKLLADFNLMELNDVKIKYKEATFEIRIPNMIINKNDKVCIVGKSGQGKTSILNLILGNITPLSGTIKIDDKDFSEYKLDIGVVSQEIELFNMSIRDNLCLDKDISDKELEMYFEELDLSELYSLEEGVNTLVGEKGLKLSTGQKRRINILRSYLMDKSVYVLDEPTSNLDKYTEDIVVNFILKYFKDKTLIISTHNEEIKKVCNDFYEVEDHTLSKL